MELLELISKLTDDCEEAPAEINVYVANISFVRLEISTQGCPEIEFDIKTLDTGLKLIHAIAKAMKEAKVKGIEDDSTS